MHKKERSRVEVAFRARQSRARLRNRREPGMWVARERVLPLALAWIARHDAEHGGIGGRAALAFRTGLAPRNLYRILGSTVQVRRLKDGRIYFSGAELFLSLDLVDRFFEAMDCQYLWHIEPSIPGGSDGFSDVYNHPAIIGMESEELVAA